LDFRLGLGLDVRFQFDERFSIPQGADS